MSLPFKYEDIIRVALLRSRHTFTYDSFITFAKKILKENGKSVEISRMWPRLFINRHPELSSKIVEPEIVRKESITQCRGCRIEFKLCDDSTDFLLEIFTDLTTIPINSKDLTPKHFCNTCREKLLDFSSFKETCLSSHQAFVAAGLAEGTEDEVDLSTVDVDQQGLAPEMVIIEEDGVQEEGSMVEQAPESMNFEISEGEVDSDMEFQKNCQKRAQNPIPPPRPQITCNECGIQMRNRAFFISHWNYKHAVDEQESTCPECSETFVSTYQLEYHLRKTHGILMCMYCDRVDTIKSGPTALNNHMKHFSRCRDAAANYDYECERCGRKISSAARQIRHQERCEGRTKKCPTCLKHISNRNWANHIQTHDKEGFKCRFCDSRLKHAQGRDFHEKYYHGGGEKFKCGTCGKEFVTKSKVTQHFKLVHEKRTFRKECLICGKRVFNLPLHSRIHSEARPFKCPVPGCDKDYKDKHSLKIHGHTHSNTRPYYCIFCHNGFYITSLLRNHYKREHGLDYEKGVKVPSRQSLDEPMMEIQYDQE